MEKLKIIISGSIEDNENNKITNFKLEGTSNDEIYADDVIKALSKLGVSGKYEISGTPPGKKLPKTSLNNYILKNVSK